MTTEKYTIESVARDIPAPVIPDGGLGDALPEWLRTTPSWTKAPDAPRAIPEPDTSVIDPASLVTIDDLPAWLRAVAARSASKRPQGAAGAVAPATLPLADLPLATSETPRIDAVDASSVEAALAQVTAPTTDHMAIQVVGALSRDLSRRLGREPGELRRV